MRRDPAELPFATRLMYRVTNAVATGLITLGLALPYAMRVRFMGWAMARLVAPVAGYVRRARAHVDYVLPHLPEAEKDRIARASLNNAGRTLIENYSTRAFLARLAKTDITGPGFDAMQQAAGEGRPVILVTGHFGNYEAVRAALVSRGFAVGGLYREMKNPYFNDHYVRTMQSFGGPVFPQGRRGTAGFVRHLKGGGQLVLLFDQHAQGQPALQFLGHDAQTAISAAELALRYDALLIPFYGTRAPDGLSFDCEMEAPIPHSDPLAMTQAMNDSLSARIRANPEQWFWVARRWRSDADLR
ncbi:lysophospholipid acyltransferase family protein [Tateyamaria sp. SN6-1]|uniref:lysophospholipid acyltransferase family protein n=1 Tax=Tateyamaria sp. SN6-1 TaxID=3092148 RepID=UPI0039F5FBC8